MTVEREGEFWPTRIAMLSAIEATIPYERGRATVSVVRTELTAADGSAHERPGILARLFGR
jgi:hypothetical protein